MSFPTIYITAFHVPADSMFAALASWDYYKMHQLLACGFGDKAELQAARLLFRFDVEGNSGFLYAQSKIKPDWSRIEEHLPGFILDTESTPEFSVIGPKPLSLLGVENGAILRFRLLARPTMRIGDKKNPEFGRRVSLDFEEKQREWLEDKAEFHGFKIERCTITDRLWHDSRLGEVHRGMPKMLKGIQFDGILSVTESAEFYLAIASGIGTQKSYGFGLLSVAPV